MIPYVSPMNQCYVKKVNKFLLAYFSEGLLLDVEASQECLTLVVATIGKATRSFSEGQRVYIYDVFWCENDRARVIGRYRKKYRFICPPEAALPVRRQRDLSALLLSTRRMQHDS